MMGIIDQDGTNHGEHGEEHSGHAIVQRASIAAFAHRMRSPSGGGWRQIGNAGVPWRSTVPNGSFIQQSLPSARRRAQRRSRYRRRVCKDVRPPDRPSADHLAPARTNLRDCIGRWSFPGRPLVYRGAQPPDRPSADHLDLARKGSRDSLVRRRSLGRRRI
jgi:hypothetical protein